MSACQETPPPGPQENLLTLEAREADGTVDDVDTFTYSLHRSHFVSTGLKSDDFGIGLERSG